jgi:hypothetical protein
VVVVVYVTVAVGVFAVVAGHSWLGPADGEK